MLYHEAKMTSRSYVLQNFIDCVETFFASPEHAAPPVRHIAERIFSTLREARTEPVNIAAARLPVCSFLGDAVANAGGATEPTIKLAGAFANLEPALAWTRRKGWENESAAFAQGHANTMIIGPGGLEPRDDVWIGASLMAPNTRYPDHSHPPEELYAVLSGGEWRQAENPWFEPGVGGVVHNTPGIVHAMRSGDKPLLAIWCLRVQ
jgi:quercetin dioxygenase-like cupin family protein